MKTHYMRRRGQMGLLSMIAVAGGFQFSALADNSLQFDGFNDYVNLGTTSRLGLPRFTVETWFKRTGTGSTVGTGTGGVTAVPLVTKGRGEADGSNVDLNYFLGITSPGNLLCADFEEGATGTSPGLNHPVTGATVIQNNVWYHAAVTYDESTLKLYLNGALQGQVTVNQPTRSDSIQGAALGSALNSVGAPLGYFQGVLDEPRIWSYARTAEQLSDGLYRGIPNDTGLVGRWSLNETSGLVANDSSGGGSNGTLVLGPLWVTGGPGIVEPTNPPPILYISSPNDGATLTVGSSPTITVQASDPNGTVTKVEFFVGDSKIGEDATAPYSIVWPSITQGQKCLFAYATDNLGAQSSSLPIGVKVGTGSILSRGPYLQNPTPTSITLRWRSSAATDSRVYYGTQYGSIASSSVTIAGTRTSHEVTLTGLTPNTKYYYAVGSSTSVLAGVISNPSDPSGLNNYFITSVVLGTQAPTRVWVIGDAGRANADQRAVRDAFYARASSDNRLPDFWLMLGDNAYETGIQGEYQAAVFDMYPSLLRNSPYWPTRGNHDTDLAAYLDIHTLPNGEQFYSFDYGNIHFVCLDSFGSNRTSTVAGSMRSWVQTDLQNTTAEWIVAFFHHPPYSNGSHHTDDLAANPESKDMREIYLPILENFGVDLVLCGHSHVYERSYLIDGHYGTGGTNGSVNTWNAATMLKNSGLGSPATPYVKNAGESHAGAVYSVVGNSGSYNATAPAAYPAYITSKGANGLASMILDVSANELTVNVLRQANATAAVNQAWDQFKIRHTFDPYFDTIPDLYLHFASSSKARTVPLTGLTSAYGGLAITATSSNQAVVSNGSIATSPLNGGSITFTPVGNVAGPVSTTITVTATNSGPAGGLPNTTVRTFKVYVFNQYSVTTLGTPFNWLDAFALNELGTVVGQGDNPNYNIGDEIGFTAKAPYAATVTWLLQPLPGITNYNSASDINIFNTAAGHAFMPGGAPGISWPVVWNDGGQAISLMSQSGFARAINDNNEVAGYTGSNSQAMYWQYNGSSGASSTINLHPAGASSSHAEAINEKGQIAGDVYYGFGLPVSQAPVVWEKNGASYVRTDLANLPGCTYGWGRDINNAQVFVGHCSPNNGQYFAAYWKKQAGVWSAANPLTGYTGAPDVNFHNHVVVYGGTGRHVVDIATNPVSDLNISTIVGAQAPDSISDINDRGQIVGDKGNLSVVLTPIIQ